MKKFTTFVFLSFVLFSINSLSRFKIYAEEKIVSIPVTLSYGSVYWWRGVELNGDGVGVYWPGAGLAFGDTGIELSIAAGLSEDLFTVENRNPSDDVPSSEKEEKVKTELDYGVSCSKDIGDKITLGVGVLFAHYPYYDEIDADAKDPSFIEASISAGMDILLSPTLDFYYDYYIEESADKTPQNEDYYATLSMSHDLISTDDGFSFSLSALIGYYNNAYTKAKGWSDAVVSAGMSKEYKDFSFSAAAYYGRSLDKDFRAGGIKNHFWADFGVTYTL